MPVSESERKKVAKARLKYLETNAKKLNKSINPNVLRDLVANHLVNKGLFKNYEAARKWATNWIFDKI